MRRQAILGWPKTFQYDLAGRTTRVSNGSAVTNLTYDDEDRLMTLVGPGVSHSYTYNGFDTRVSKTANGSLTAYHRDGAGVTAPLVGDSGATYTPGISEKRNGVSTFMHGGLKDNSVQSDVNQNITATRVYDAYGMTLASTGTWKGPFGYSGQAGYQEDETGLQLLGHRYYDSSTGRFLTRDPIKDGRNWYGYAGNNPINAIDADGLQPTQVTDRNSPEWKAIEASIREIEKTDKERAKILMKMLVDGDIWLDDTPRNLEVTANDGSKVSVGAYVSSFGTWTEGPHKGQPRPKLYINALMLKNYGGKTSENDLAPLATLLIHECQHIMDFYDSVEGLSVKEIHRKKERSACDTAMAFTQNKMKAIGGGPVWSVWYTQYKRQRDYRSIW